MQASLSCPNSEYVVWWHKTHDVPCAGWGMTLRGVSSDWARDLENFTPTYGADGTGDVYKVWGCHGDIFCYAWYRGGS